VIVPTSDVVAVKSKASTTDKNSKVKPVETKEISSTQPITSTETSVITSTVSGAVKAAQAKAIKSKLAQMNRTRTINSDKETNSNATHTDITNTVTSN